MPGLGLGLGLHKLPQEIGGEPFVPASTSYLLDGVDECFIADSVNDDIDTATGTWSIWVKFVAAAGSSEVLMALGDTDGDNDIMIFKGVTGKINFFCRVAGVVQWELVTDDVVLSDDTWTHVAGVQNGTESVTYIDGVAVAQTFTTSVDRTVWVADYAGVLDNARLGCRNRNSGGNTLHMNGNITEIAYWDTNLSSAQIVAIFNSGVPGDLTSLSPTTWFRPDNGVFAAGDWTMTDEQPAGNTAISLNMEEADRVNDAP